MKRFSRLAKVLIQALIFLLLAICLHEYAHIQMIQFLGGEGYVKYTILSGYTGVTLVPLYPYWSIMTALAGGCTVASVFYVLDGLIQKNDTSIAFRLVIGHQLSYALMESLGPKITPICGIIIGLGMSLSLIWSFPLIKKIIIE